MAKYKIRGDGYFDTELGMFIPNDPQNRHYQMVQTWIGEGNTPDPEFTEQEITDNLWAEIRSVRDSLLKQTDFMVLSDVFSHYNTTEQGEITTYRQGLRNVPENTSDPTNPAWPARPQVVIDVVGAE